MTFDLPCISDQPLWQEPGLWQAFPRQALRGQCDVQRRIFHRQEQEHTLPGLQETHVQQVIKAPLLGIQAQLYYSIHL